MSIIIGNLKACKVKKGERFAVHNNYAAEALPTYYELLKVLEAEISHGKEGFDIAIPCMQNRLVVIDIDVKADKGVDGRARWRDFARAYNIPNTFTVCSRSGGRHLYFELPPGIDHLTFRPKSRLFDDEQGIEIKWRGTVHAPPTRGYEVHPDSPQYPVEVPIPLMTEILKGKSDNERTPEELLFSGKHSAFTPAQIEWLRNNIAWVQENVSLTRDDWRDGVFSIKAGTVHNEEIGEELVTLWTMNQAYNVGDEVLAIDMYHKADPMGPVQGGTIIHLIRKFFEEKGVPLSLSEVMGGDIGISILEKAGVTFTISKTGMPKFIDNDTNAGLIIDTLIPKPDMYLNTRTDTYIYNGEQVSDKDLVTILLPMLQKVGGGLGFERMKKTHVQTGVDIAMRMRAIDPHVEWVKTFTWDGVPRVERFFIDMMGGEDTEYNRRLGKNMFTALAARTLKRGCKFDSMFIFEGEEGARKSTLVSLLGNGNYYSVRGRNILTADDSLRQMHQAVTVEFPELIGLRHEDPEIAKAFVTASVDKIRGLYERKAVDRPRGFVMFGTTNQEEYLSFDMGKRRWWPFKIPKGFIIDTDAVKENLGQLYAEGVELWKSGYEYWFMPERLLSDIQSSKQTGGYLREEIKRLLSRKVAFTIKELFDELANAQVLGSGGFVTWGKVVETEVRRLGASRDIGDLWKSPEHLRPAPPKAWPETIEGVL